MLIIPLCIHKYLVVALLSSATNHNIVELVHPMSYNSLHRLLEIVCFFTCAVCAGGAYTPVCVCVCACECVHSVPEWEFMSDLIDGGGIGGSAPLIEATGSTRLLINL